VDVSHVAFAMGMDDKLYVSCNAKKTISSDFMLVLANVCKSAYPYEDKSKFAQVKQTLLKCKTTGKQDECESFNDFKTKIYTIIISLSWQRFLAAWKIILWIRYSF
jgi:hypothetical protein